MSSISEAMSGMSKKPMGMASHSEPDGGHYEVHPHSDGTAHSVTPDGKQTQHPSMHHAAAHILGHHDSEGAHSVVHHHMGGHSHSHSKQGNTGGPDEHEDTEGVKRGMDKLSGEEGQGEGGRDQFDESESGSSGKSGLFD
jgi:hypothetical protein